MTDWLPDVYCAILISLSIVIAAAAGFWAGRMREQLALLEILRPEPMCGAKWGNRHAQKKRPRQLPRPLQH